MKLLQAYFFVYKSLRETAGNGKILCFFLNLIENYK